MPQATLLAALDPDHSKKFPPTAAFLPDVVGSLYVAEGRVIMPERTPSGAENLAKLPAEKRKALTDRLREVWNSGPARK